MELVLLRFTTGKPNTERKACQAVRIARSNYSYQPKVKQEDMTIMKQLSILVDQHPSIGFWMCYHRIRNNGFEWNHKRLSSVYPNEIEYSTQGKEKTSSLGETNFVSAREN